MLVGCVWDSQGPHKEWPSKLVAGNFGRLGAYMGAEDISPIENHANQVSQCLRKS